MENSQFKKQLEERTLAFAISVVKFCHHLRKIGIPNVLLIQLLKSGTSIGSNYREANRAESKKDFIHKIGIVEKEAAETVYWLDIMRQSDMIENDGFTISSKLHNEAKELLALFNSISRSSKS